MLKRPEASVLHCYSSTATLYTNTQSQGMHTAHCWANRALVTALMPQSPFHKVKVRRCSTRFVNQLLYVTVSIQSDLQGPAIPLSVLISLYFRVVSTNLQDPDSQLS